MKDIPIIMSKPMVLATLDDLKTATRRMAFSWRKVRDAVEEGKWLRAWRSTPWQNVKPGDRLWVRENLVRMNSGDWRYAADQKPVTLAHGDSRVAAMVAWAHHYDHDAAPSIHMPRWASRLTLIVTKTKIEKLQMIRTRDAKAEGTHRSLPGSDAWYEADPRRYVMAFRAVFEHLHGPTVWDDNPEVVALTFTVHKQNIDTMPKAIAA